MEITVDHCGFMEKDWRKSMDFSHIPSAYGVFENLRFHDEIWDVASRIGSISTNLYEKLILVDLESTVWVVETQPSEIGSFSERSERALSILKETKNRHKLLSTAELNAVVKIEASLLKGVGDILKSMASLKLLFLI